MKKSTKAELAALVRAAQNGDESAIANLVRATQDDLYRFLLFLVRNRQLAQDFSQDTFIKAIENLSSLRDPMQFQSWLFRTAKNLYLDHLRSPKNAESDSDDDLKNLAQDYESVEALVMIKSMMDTLAPDDRYGFLLVYLEDYSYAEAAELVGISENALRSRLHRIRAQLVQQDKEKIKKAK